MNEVSHPDLIGRPFNYQVVVNSGAGGNTTVALVIPLGEIWFLKFATAYHDDGTAARVVAWYLDDPISAVNLQLPGGASVTAGTRADFPFGTYVQGPLVCCLGGLNLRIVAQALAANKNGILEVHGHKIRGAWPLV